MQVRGTRHFISALFLTATKYFKAPTFFGLLFTSSAEIVLAIKVPSSLCRIFFTRFGQ